MKRAVERSRQSESDAPSASPGGVDEETTNDHTSRNGDHGKLASEDVIRDEIISQFPQDHLVHCFGYGSGVFSQNLANDTHAAGMLDLILVVENTKEFHQKNLLRFPHHYAPWLRYGGANLITRIQRQGFPWLQDAHVLFHVVDQDENLPKMKYGVVDRDDLERDLTRWESLYLAGRLHKPTLPIVSRDDSIVKAQDQNLKSATAAALLLSESSSELSWLSLYRQIASLSYTGDFRMQVGGEDPKKLDKLVQAPGQLQRFHDLYRPILKSYETSGVLSRNENGIEWASKDPSTTRHLRDQLPPSLREDHRALTTALAAIVAPAARNQSFKGVFTLGFRKSLQYASAKLSKGLLSRK